MYSFDSWMSMGCVVWDVYVDDVRGRDLTGKLGLNWTWNQFLITKTRVLDHTRREAERREGSGCRKQKCSLSAVYTACGNYDKNKKEASNLSLHNYNKELPISPFITTTKTFQSSRVAITKNAPVFRLHLDLHPEYPESSEELLEDLSSIICTAFSSKFVFRYSLTRRSRSLLKGGVFTGRFV